MLALRPSGVRRRAARRPGLPLAGHIPWMVRVSEAYEAEPFLTGTDVGRPYVFPGFSLHDELMLLVLSNLFMTFAWYGHLRHTHRALWLVVVVSWGIAFFEYCLQVPANRIGYSAGLSGAELKTLQEVITLAVFVGFAAWYLREPVRWNTVAGFLFIALGATLIFAPWSKRAPREEGAPPPLEASARANP